MPSSTYSRTVSLRRMVVRRFHAHDVARCLLAGYITQVATHFMTAFVGGA